MPSQQDAQSWLARVPPPYRLRCDLAVVPVVATLADGTGRPERRCLLILLVRYTSARFGPRQERYEPVPSLAGNADLYREVALAAPAGVTLSQLAFTSLWVDTRDAAPIALGHAYGFPKQPAAVQWAQHDAWLAVAVQARGELVLDLTATLGWSWPGHVVGLLSGVWAVFPQAGRRAPMRLENVRRAALLRVRRVAFPALAVGSGVRPLPGLWLPDCVVALGAPQQLP